MSGTPGFADPNPVCDTNLWIGNPAMRVPNPNFGMVSGLEFANGSSPCVDAGTDVGQTFAPIDGDGNGTADFDMGVYEFTP